MKIPEYKALVEATNNVLSSAIDINVPEIMLEKLKSDVFVFSGLKTNAQLAEASRLLLNDDNTIRSFSQFSKEVATIKTDYNENYLEAEYKFAVASSQMAANWANVSTDYDLQYRTANDGHVRASHAALHDITLPASDTFWLRYYPPNGWRCRCNAVQVRKGKYDTSNSETANAAGEKATTQIDKEGNNKLAIFRFNPGAQNVVFPPDHPYGKVSGANTVRENLK